MLNFWTLRAWSSREQQQFGGRLLSGISPHLVDTNARTLRVLLVSDSPDWPLAVRELAATREVNVARAGTLRQARDPAALQAADAVIVWPGNEPVDEYEVMALGEAMRAQQLCGLLVNAEAAQSDAEGPFSTLENEPTPDELWGRLETMRRYRPLLQAMESQLAVMQRLGKRLNQQFVEVDQELRLASRLQRDFLPRAFPELGDIRFSALFRPATWVSGDVYDVRRLDEHTLGFYLADAVGHGVAAGLLTMFIRQSVVGKRIQAGAYRIIPCDEVLSALNNQLAEQELPNCQFVTACYGVVDVREALVTFSRGGHPHPVHVHSDGACEEVKTVGGLLGIMPGENFPAVRVHLKRGEKLIVYSDGLEDTIIARRDRQRGDGQFSEGFIQAAGLPCDEFLAHLGAIIDGTEGSLQPLDDQSCVVIERLGR